MKGTYNCAVRVCTAQFLNFNMNKFEISDVITKKKLIWDSRSLCKKVPLKKHSFTRWVQFD